MSDSGYTAEDLMDENPPCSQFWAQKTIAQHHCDWAEFVEDFPGSYNAGDVLRWLGY